MTTASRATLLLIFASGCAVAHHVPDAGGSIELDAHRADDATSSEDSPPAPDAPRVEDVGQPDAWSCADADGDGWTSASCGGEDCDDSDATQLPGSTRCVGPTRTAVCTGGVLLESECSPPTSFCDARSGVCVANACGDGVIHDGEACDPPTEFGCDPACRARCHFSSMCAAHELCIEPDGVTGHCAATSAEGLALGEPCSASDQCASGWCDPNQLVCNAGCLGTSLPRCWGLSASCEVLEGSEYGWTPGAAPPRDYFYGCEFECARDGDCRAGTVCTLRAVYPGGGPVMNATCLPRRGTGTAGSAPVGSPCDAVVGCDSNTCVDGVCTRVCAADSDCVAPLTRCVEHDFRGDFGVDSDVRYRVCGA